MNLAENNDEHYFPLVPAGKLRRSIENGKRLAIDGSTRGRPAFEVDETTLLALEHYAARGLNNKQMATCLGISYQTFNEKKKQFSDFSDAIERGQAFGISEVASALFEKAKKGDIFAIKYYLGNRSKDETGANDWQEKPEIQVNQNTQINIIVDSEDMNA